jgi:hypothetical protein
LSQIIEDNTLEIIRRAIQHTYTVNKNYWIEPVFVFRPLDTATQNSENDSITAPSGAISNTIIAISEKVHYHITQLKEKVSGSNQ